MTNLDEDEDIFEEEEDEDEEQQKVSTPSKKSPSKKKKIAPWIEKIVKDYNTDHLAKKSDLIRKVFLLNAPESEILDENREISIISLKHPRRSTNSHFIFFPENPNLILEIQRCIYPPSSYFIGESVESNGSLYLCNQIDPFFLIISLFKEINNEKFMEWTDLLMSSKSLNFRRLHGLKNFLDFSLICDVKEIDEDKFLKLNEEKLVTWLRAKLFQLIVFLENFSKDSVKSSAQSTSLRMSIKEIPPSKQEILKAALGYLSEYVADDLIKKLSETVGFSDFESTKFSAFDQLKSPEKKKFFEDEEEDVTFLKKKKVETPKKEKSKLEKANINTAGMSSLLGYFKKKN